MRLKILYTEVGHFVAPLIWYWYGMKKQQFPYLDLHIPNWIVKIKAIEIT